MDYYFAPLEGITGYIYRNAFEKYYGGVKKYFAPFISPTPESTLNAKEFRELKPEHNRSLYLVPQLLTNRSDSFIHTARQLRELGYEEINLNLGCPSGTVTAKGKGSGFLNKLPELKTFLDDIYNAQSLQGMEISIKTRIGRNEPEEFEEILALYNQFPVSELIVHPRVQKDFYKHEVRRQYFWYALKESVNPVVYNGDLFEKADVELLQDQIQKQGKEPVEMRALMLGRGLLRNPSLLQTEKGPLKTSSPDYETLRAFHDEIYHGYQKIMAPDRNVLFRMKELWTYLIWNFPDAEKAAKKLRKAEDYGTYESVVMQLFAGAVNTQN